MTPNEIQALIVGAAIGAHGMNILHAHWQAKAARKAAARALATAKRSAGDRYLNSLHVYRLRQEMGLTP